MTVKREMTRIEKMGSAVRGCPNCLGYGRYRDVAADGKGETFDCPCLSDGKAHSRIAFKGDAEEERQHVTCVYLSTEAMLHFHMDALEVMWEALGRSREIRIEPPPTRMTGSGSALVFILSTASCSMGSVTTPRRVSNQRSRGP